MHLSSHSNFAAVNGGSKECYDTIEALPERVRAIATLRGLGYSYREIGRLFSVTPQAVSLMLGRHKRTIKKLGSSLELQQLSARAVNALGRHRIRSREEARDCDVLALLLNERNCGRKTQEEIAKWMSQRPVPAEGSPDAKVCHGPNGAGLACVG